MRNLTVIVAWHGGSPKVSPNCTDPKGSTFSSENPRRWVLTGSSFSLPMPILSKADAKMMSAELPLSTRTRTAIYAKMKLHLIGHSSGCHGMIKLKNHPGIEKLPRSDKWQQ